MTKQEEFKDAEEIIKNLTEYKNYDLQTTCRVLSKAYNLALKKRKETSE